MSRRVLVLNQFALPRSAPGGTRHVELCEQMHGWDATILVGRRGLLDQQEVKDEGSLVTVPVTRYGGNGPSRIVNWISYTVAAFLRGVFAPRPDVVYGSSPHMGAALAAWSIAFLRRAHFVLEVRDLWPKILVDTGMMGETSAVYRALKMLERFLYRRAELIVVLAKGSATDIIAEGIDPEKVVFIPNGADPEDFAVQEDREALRNRWGFEGFVFVYAGAHGPANGLDLVLDAAHELVTQDSPVRFVLLGDGVEKPRLQERARVEGLSNVDFRDPVAKSLIPEVLAAADAGLHCLADIDLFRRGVSPNKLYDYMAAGRPVLTNTLGEVAEMVRAADAGLAVEPTEIASGAAGLAGASGAELATFSSGGLAWMKANRSRVALSSQLALRLAGLC